MKICIAGKNDIAVNVTDFILKNHESYLQDLYIVLNRSDDGKNGFQRSLKYYAIKNKLKIVSLDEVYSFRDLIFISLEFDQLIKPNYFASSQLYNVHFSALPKYKGMYTSAWPLLNQEDESGVTLHKIEEGIDTGDIIDQYVFPLSEAETARSLYKKYIKYGTDLLLEYLPKLFSNEIIFSSQSAHHSSYYSKKSIEYNSLTLNIKQVAVSISAQIKAFNFREYQLPMIHGYPIIDSKVLSSKSIVKAGSILSESIDHLIISTIDYDLYLIKDNFTLLMDSAKLNHSDTIDINLKKTANAIDDQNENGWTSLMVAAYNASYESFQLLLQHGADPYLTNHNGTTVLMYAKDGYEVSGDPRIFQTCLDLGLNPEIKDYNDKNLYEYCEQNKQIKSLNFLKNYLYTIK